MRKFIFVIIFSFLKTVPEVYGQTDISMATNWYNRANYNPASITRDNYLYLFSSVQKQWLGVGGSPTVLNVQTSQYYYDLHSAFGISFVNDKLALTNSINPMLSYAYRITGKSGWYFSMGISGGVFCRSLDGSMFDPADSSDPSLYNNLITSTEPDANLGFEFQSQHLILGLSTTHLFSFGKTDNIYLNSNHIYSYLSYKNTLSELFNYNAGLQLVKGPVLTVLEGNVSIRAKHPTGLTSGGREIFDLGLSYRTSKQLLLLFGINISPDFRMGYIYDQSFSIGFNSNSTHEIMLEYRIPSKLSSNCHCKNEGSWYY